MNYFFIALSWLFLSLALFFLMGLLKTFARRFYPGMPGVVARSAAPVIFACLSIACFQGAGLPALLVVVIAGIVQIGISRKNCSKQRITA